MDEAGNLLLQVGVGGILAVLIIKEVLAFLEKWRNGKNRQTNPDEPVHRERLDGIDCRLETLTSRQERQGKRVEDLWEWHNVRGQDGVFVWYVRSSLEDAILQLSENIATQTEIMRELVIQQRESCKTIERMEARHGRGR